MTFGHRADIRIGIYKLDLAVFLKISCRNPAAAVDIQLQRAVFGAMGADRHVLEIQQQLDNVFFHARDRRKFVLSAFHADRADCRSLNRRKQHAAKSVTYRLTVTAFERSDHQPCGGAGTLFNLNLRPHNLQRSPHLSYNSIARWGYDGFCAALTTKCAY